MLADVGVGGGTNVMILSEAHGPDDQLGGAEVEVELNFFLWS